MKSMPMYLESLLEALLNSIESSCSSSFLFIPPSFLAGDLVEEFLLRTAEEDWSHSTTHPKSISPSSLSCDLPISLYFKPDIVEMLIAFDDDCCWCSFCNTGRVFLEFVTVGEEVKENDAGDVGGGEADLSFAIFITVADLFLRNGVLECWPTGPAISTSPGVAVVGTARCFRLCIPTCSSLRIL